LKFLPCFKNRKARIRLEIVIEIRLEFNQSEVRRKKINLKFSELCFDWLKSNSMSISISSLIRVLRFLKWGKNYKWANSLGIDQRSYKNSSKFAHFCNFHLVSRIMIDPLNATPIVSSTKILWVYEYCDRYDSCFLRFSQILEASSFSNHFNVFFVWFLSWYQDDKMVIINVIFSNGFAHNSILILDNFIWFSTYGQVMLTMTVDFHCLFYYGFSWIIDWIITVN